MAAQQTQQSPGSTLRVSVDAPVFPAGSTISHVATSWEFSTYPDFIDRTYVTLSDLLNTTNLTSYDYTVPDMDSPVYARLKFHFTNNLETNWSKVIIVRIDQQPIIHKDIVISTPVISTEVISVNNVSMLNITATDFRAYAGVANHTTTDWIITDGFNNEIYSSMGDSKNLTSLSVDMAMFDKLTTYIIKARYNSDVTDIISNYAAYIFKTEKSSTEVFDITIKSDFVPERDIYFKVIDYSKKFSSIDITILDPDGNTVDSFLGLNNIDGVIINTNKINFNITYSIYAKMNLSDGTSTDSKLVFNGKPSINHMIPRNQYAAYMNKYTLAENIELNTMTIQSSVQLLDGTILISRHHDNNIYRYEMYNGILTEVGVAFTLTGNNDMMDKQFINIVQLENGDILVDYDAIREVHSGSPLMPPDADPTNDDLIIIADGQNIVKYRPRFDIYKYNQNTKTFTYDRKVSRDDELYGTSPTNALVVIGNNVYYIPSFVEDNNDLLLPGSDLVVNSNMTVAEKYFYNSITIQEGNVLTIVPADFNVTYKDLPIRKLDMSTMTVSDVTGLPVPGIKSFGSLAYLDDDNLFFTGGCSYSYEDQYHVTLYDRINNDIYKYTISTNTFTKISTLPISSMPSSVYAIQTYIRKDNNIVMFNGVDTGNSVGDQSIYVYDVKYNLIVTYTNPINTDTPIRNTILLRDGTMLRITTRVEDPQVVFHYTAYGRNSLSFKNNKNTTINDVISGSDTIVPLSDSKIGKYDHDSEETVTINTSTDEAKVIDLMVPAGVTQLIEDPFVYNHIKVLGTSYDDTGLLQLLYHEYTFQFRYRDLVVVKTDTINSTDTFDSITMFEGTTLIVN